MDGLELAPALESDRQVRGSEIRMPVVISGPKAVVGGFDFDALKRTFSHGSGSGRLAAIFTAASAMTLKRRVALVRWLLIFALLGCGDCTSRVAMLAYFMQPTADVSIFRPATAEEVGRIAQPYQSNTRETDGMFRIVQKQHVDLDMMFSRLETAAQLSWTLALASAVVLAALSCVFAVCLALVWSVDRRLTQALCNGDQCAAGSI